jgi:hypothetical protein
MPAALMMGLDAGGGAREEERRRPRWRFAVLLNHRAGERSQLDWHVDGLQVDDKLELGRKLNRQIHSAWRRAG